MPDADARIGGRYRLVRKLADGGMGTVWEGYDERLQRTVAIKQLHVQPGLSESDTEVAVQRAMREARLTARLHHPNAVQVFDVVDDHNRPCLIMQYVPSRSLQDVVRDEGPLPPEQVARIGTQIAAALAAAHRAGIVHRDVKPGNVLIAEDGTAKITDFGISHAFDDVTLTSTGMVTGTPAYLAPEVARGESTDFATDVYSLAATLYMAAEGIPPFGTDPNPMAVLHRVASGHTIPPQRSGPLTPVLAAMMAPDPGARPSMVEIANTLPDIHRSALATAGAADPTRRMERPQPDHTLALPVAPPVVRPRPAAEPEPAPTPRGSRHVPWVPIVAVLLLLAVGGVLAIVLAGSGTSGSAASHSSPPTRTRSSSAPGTPSTSSTVRSSTSAATSSHATKPTKPAKPTEPRHETPPTAAQLANAIVDYYSIVPGNLDAGWAHLTARFQHTTAHNRQTYDRYWNSIDRVDVSNASGRSPGTAIATLTYHYKDGRTITERTQFGLVRRDGILKIDSSQSAG